MTTTQSVEHLAARRTATSGVGRLRAARWRHPEVPLVAAIVVAWIALAVDHWAGHDQIDSVPARFDFSVVSWTAMVIAMMVPGVLPMARHVAFNSLWSRRRRSLFVFTGAYIAVWVGLGIAGAAVIRVLEFASGMALTSGRPALIITGAAAVGWQLTPAKRRALRRCHLRLPLAARGWAADRSAVRYGVVHGWACAGSCWAIMAMMLVAHHDFHLMVPLAAITIVERYQRRPRGEPGAVAIALAVAISVL